MGWDKMDKGLVQRIYIEFQDETLLIDRKEGSFEYAKRKDSKNFFYHLYQDKQGVEKLLDFFGDEVHFERQLQEELPYRLTINYSNQSQKIILSACKSHQWSLFLIKMNTFIALHNDGELIPSGFEPK